MTEDLQECEQTETAITRWLDHLSPSLPESVHTQSCTSCRASIEAARRLGAGLSALPREAPSFDFTDRVVRIALLERRQRRLRRVALIGSCAASFLLALAFLDRRSPESGVKPAPSEIATRPPRVADQFAEARTAALSLSRKTADHALDPARDLFQIPQGIPKEPTPAATSELFVSLQGAGDGAREGLSPLADVADRAFHHFRRDVTLGTR